jgi:hypothetical protein
MGKLLSDEPFTQSPTSVRIFFVQRVRSNDLGIQGYLRVGEKYASLDCSKVSTEFDTRNFVPDTDLTGSDRLLPESTSSSLVEQFFEVALSFSKK